eukprot:GHVQ01006395.1.p1 GENE.GHVQ01006395.1~~GHVQ01006395.1.p1  ORF type:complete len:133 (+),score=13.78 GHVQ01006395.1:213-611(+)
MTTNLQIQSNTNIRTYQQPYKAECTQQQKIHTNFSRLAPSLTPLTPPTQKRTHHNTPPQLPPTTLPAMVPLPMKTTTYFAGHAYHYQITTQVQRHVLHECYVLNSEISLCLYCSKPCCDQPPILYPALATNK